MKLACTWLFCLLLPFVSLANPSIVAFVEEEISDDCSSVSDFVLGEVLSFDYTATLSDGTCLAISTLIHFGDDGIASEILSDGTVLSSYAYTLTSAGGQCEMSSGDFNCDVQTLVLDGDLVTMSHDGMTATLSESSVSYGCMDEDYLEYDSEATLADGSCSTLFVQGCQDDSACNYNASATEGGVVCLYANEICETCSGETDGTGTVIDNDSDDDEVCDANEIAGCQDDLACNFNASATDGGTNCLYTDGICETCSGETDGTGTVIDNDSDDDEVCDANEIAGCQDPLACNFNASATDGGIDCLYTDGICETCSGETDGTGTVIDNDSDDDEVCDANEIAGCQDPLACNFNASATDGVIDCLYTDGICETCSGETDGTGTVIDNDSDDDEVCDANEIAGCQDPLACNFNASATDGGIDCLYTDGICETCSGETDGTGTVIDNDSDDDEVCDANEIAGCQDPLACNFNASATDGGINCLYTDGICETCSGETDGTGTVIDNDSDDDEVCDANEIAGCQDPLACNFNASATDGGINCLYTDGICETCSGETDGTGTVIDNDSDDDEVCDANEIAGCQDPLACNFNASATDGGIDCQYTDGICETCSGETDGTGTVIDNDTDNDEVCDSDEIPGCTNANANNYNPDATDDDGSCPVGCMWPDACNYNSGAIEDDGSCEFDSCVGCMDPVACNYDASATLSGACIYAALYQDCDGNCVNDADGDGNCDEIEANGVEGCTDCGGCTDIEAVNYEAGATIDDGSCQYSGCTYPSSCNYDPNANINDGSCSFLSAAVIGSVELVTSATSLISADGEISVTIDSGDPILLEVTGLNGAADYAFDLNGTGIYGGIAPGFYSVTAVDASSCSSEAVRVIVSYDLCCDCGESDQDADGICDNNDNCTNRRAINYADTNNGGCIIPGCMNPAYTEYYSEATIDDGSCATLAVGGCTDPDYDEYNSAANTDDGSCQTLVSNCDSPSMDGYSYAVVEIGDQCWFAENLRTTLYGNGDAIPAGLTDAEWTTTTSGATAVFGEGSSTCYNHSPDIDACDEAQSLGEYGRLYNWYAVDDERGLCPSGWHVPTDLELTDLENHISSQGLSGTEGTALKSTYGWHNGGNGTDGFGFSALPGGGRIDASGAFSGAGFSGLWWGSSPNGGSFRALYSPNTVIFRGNVNPRNGFSVRCLRDADHTESQGCTDPSYLEFDASANVDDGSCTTLVVEGCTDPDYTEYNASANTDDGSCTTLIVEGCTDPAYDEYDSAANTDDGSCQTLASNCDSPSMDGYSYAVVEIGDQCWFAENLRTTVYADGSDILEVTDNGAWAGLSSGARCDYDNDVSNVATYGRLYNWYAVNSGIGLCPSGWHVPTDGEWTELEDYLGANGHSGAEGRALMSTSGWYDGGIGTDDFGFSALPGGGRNGYDGLFDSDAGLYGNWWSSSPSGGNAWNRYLYYYNPVVYRLYNNPLHGFSVRCLRDAE